MSKNLSVLVSFSAKPPLFVTILPQLQINFLQYFGPKIHQILIHLNTFNGELLLIESINMRE